MSVSKIQNELINRYMASNALLDDIELSLEKMVAKNRAYILTGEISYLEEMTGVRKRFTESIKTLKELLVSEAEAEAEALIMAIESVAAEHYAAVEKMIELRRQGVDLKKVVDFFEAEVRPRKDAVSIAVNKASSYEDAEFSRAKAHATKTHHVGYIFQIAAGFFCLAFGVFLFWILSRTVVQKQKSEESLRITQEISKQAIRVAELGIFDHDLINDVVHWSPEIKVILGMQPDEQMSVSGFLKMVPVPDRAAITAAIQRAHDINGDGAYSVEHRIQHRDGTTHWVRTKAQTFFAEEETSDKNIQRTAVRAVGAMLDITKDKEREEVLAKEKLKLQRSNRELEQFAEVAAHDLRTPITTLRTWLDMLVQLIPAPRSAELDNALVIVKNNAKKADDLVEDILQIARVNISDLNIEKINLEQMLSEIFIALKSEISSAKAQIHRTPLPKIYGHKSLLESVFTNLIRNALVYREKTRILEITIGYTEHIDNYEFFVKDNGIGIDPQFTGRIFEMFRRVHSKKKYPGTGIGLAFCKKVVELSGGKIWVDSLSGQGSTFYFTYPKKWNDHKI